MTHDHLLTQREMDAERAGELPDVMAPPEQRGGPGMPGDGDWFAFLGNHKRKMTDVECPSCDSGRCNCLGVLVPICAEDEEDWPCTHMRAFLAGRMSGIRLAASKLEGDADSQPTAARMNLLRRLAAELENEADRISRGVEDIGDLAPEPSTMPIHWERS